MGGRLYWSVEGGLGRRLGRGGGVYLLVLFADGSGRIGDCETLVMNVLVVVGGDQNNNQ